MATNLAISKATEMLAAAFPTFRRSDLVIDIIAEALVNCDDDEITRAARRLIATATRAPAVADLIAATRSIAASRAALAGHSTTQPQYTEYSDRPPAERKAIDEARRECARVMGALARGVSVFDLFPPDSEPCKLARRMLALRGEPTTKTETTPALPHALECDWMRGDW